MRRWKLVATLALLIAFAAALPARAALPTVTVTDTLRAPDGTLVAGGSIVAELVAGGGPGTAPDTITSAPLPVQGKARGTISGAGVMSIVLTPNVLITPANSYYLVTVTPAGSKATPFTAKWQVPNTDPCAYSALTILSQTPPAAPPISGPIGSLLAPDGSGKAQGFICPSDGQTPTWQASSSSFVCAAGSGALPGGVTGNPQYKNGSIFAGATAITWTNGGASESRKVRYQDFDTNGDGTPDLRVVGDYDGDGTLELVDDILAAYCAFAFGAAVSCDGQSVCSCATTTPLVTLDVDRDGTAEGVSGTLEILPGRYVTQTGERFATFAASNWTLAGLGDGAIIDASGITCADVGGYEKAIVRVNDGAENATIAGRNVRVDNITIIGPGSRENNDSACNINRDCGAGHTNDRGCSSGSVVTDCAGGHWCPIGRQEGLMVKDIRGLNITNVRVFGTDAQAVTLWNSNDVRVSNNTVKAAGEHCYIMNSPMSGLTFDGNYGEQCGRATQGDFLALWLDYTMAGSFYDLTISNNTGRNLGTAFQIENVTSSSLSYNNVNFIGNTMEGGVARDYDGDGTLNAWYAIAFGTSTGVTANDVVFKDNVFSNFTAGGLLTNEVTAGSIQRARYLNNTFSNVRNEGSFVVGAAIKLDGAWGEFSHNAITDTNGDGTLYVDGLSLDADGNWSLVDNEIRGYSGNGINVANAKGSNDNIVLDSNRISSKTGEVASTGIQVGTNKNVTLRKNLVDLTVTASADTKALQVGAGSHVSVSGNAIKLRGAGAGRSHGAIVLNSTADFQVTTNQIDMTPDSTAANQGFIGINIGSATDGIIAGNTLQGTSYGIYLGSAARLTVSENECRQYSHCIFANGTTTSVIARNRADTSGGVYGYSGSWTWREDTASSTNLWEGNHAIKGYVDASSPGSQRNGYRGSIWQPDEDANGTLDTYTPLYFFDQSGVNLPWTVTRQAAAEPGPALAANQVRCYVKGAKYVCHWYDGSNNRYYYLDLTATTNQSWIYSATAP